MTADQLDPAIVVLEALNRAIVAETRNAQDAADRFEQEDPDKSALYSGVATVGRILCAVTYQTVSMLKEQRDELDRRVIN